MCLEFSEERCMCSVLPIEGQLQSQARRLIFLNDCDYSTLTAVSCQFWCSLLQWHACKGCFVLKFCVDRTGYVVWTRFKVFLQSRRHSIIWLVFLRKLLNGLNRDEAHWLRFTLNGPQYQCHQTFPIKWYIFNVSTFHSNIQRRQKGLGDHSNVALPHRKNWKALNRPLDHLIAKLHGFFSKESICVCIYMYMYMCGIVKLCYLSLAFNVCSGLNNHKKM